MDTAMIARVLWLRRLLRRRERWSRAQVEGYQRRELAALRSHAVLGSPFYQRFHQGLRDAPLAELPVLTKATLLDHFDEIAADPTLRLDDLQAYLAGLAGDERFAGRCWVSSASGSTLGQQPTHVRTEPADQVGSTVIAVRLGQGGETREIGKQEGLGCHLGSLCHPAPEPGSHHQHRTTIVPRRGQVHR